MTTKSYWRPVMGFEGFYEVSDDGRVRSCDRRIQVHFRATGETKTRHFKGKELSQHFDRKGYKRITLSWKGEQGNRTVHSLVCESFIGQCPPDLEIRHLNGNPSDNQLTNLLYGTRSENGLDRLVHGTCAQAIKPDCNHGHALRHPNLVLATFNRCGKRECASCTRGREVVRCRKLSGVGDCSIAERRRIADERYAAIMEVSA